MATLADELLNDFEDSGSGGEEEQNEVSGDEESKESIDRGLRRSTSTLGEGLNGEDEVMSDAEEEIEAKRAARADSEDAGDEEDVTARVEKMKMKGVSDVKSVAKLKKQLDPVIEVSSSFSSLFPLWIVLVYILYQTVLTRCAILQSINHFKTVPPEQRANIGSIEDNPEYKLLTEANALSTSIDGEIVLVHKFIRDHYSIRFPELETLVGNPLDFAKTVAILKNGPLDRIQSIASSTDNMVGAPLRSVLEGPTLMVVTVEGTTTKGREMSESELQTVLGGCQMMLDLEKAKKILIEYVQSRMNVFAPNLTALIGSLTAAQLLNYAGGVTGLAKTPACNIPILGTKKQTQTGFATNVGVRQQGFLYHSPIIEEIPSDLKRQAMRIVSAKLVLAARVDRVHQSPDGSTGQQLRDQTIDRLEKLTEPPPNRGPRALPAPDDKPARKRGGRRARKAKEAVAMTDLRKQQNRMAFGQEEREVGYGTGEGTVGLGMIGQQNQGRIRAEQIDQRTRAKLSKKNPGWGNASVSGGTASSLRGFGSGVPGSATSLRASGLRTSGIGGGAGTASSIAFTPVQGLELVDPKIQAEMKRKRQADEDRWFKGGTFTQVGGSSSTGTPGSAASSGGFKVPGLPASKKINTGTNAGKMGPPALPGK